MSKNRLLVGVVFEVFDLDVASGSLWIPKAEGGTQLMYAAPQFWKSSPVWILLI